MFPVGPAWIRADQHFHLFFQETFCQETFRDLILRRLAVRRLALTVAVTDSVSRLTIVEVVRPVIST